MKSIFIGGGVLPSNVKVGEQFYAIGVKTSAAANLDSWIKKYEDQIKIDYRAPEVGNFGYYNELSLHVLQLAVFTRTK